MRAPKTVEALTKLGRVRLSRSFFMRDFLYSEIAAVHGILNVPDNPDLAIRVGTKLCEELLEPLQERWGRIAIRSAYRSAELNAFGNQMQKQRKSGYTCASNEANAAGHIWDLADTDGLTGATACIVLPLFWEQHQNAGDWRMLAHWIDQNLPYSALEFFPTYWAFNISWHERPKRQIYSYAEPKGLLLAGKDRG